MHEEAWAGKRSIPRTLGERLLELIHENNDETSVKRNLLSYCINVFHVQDKAFPVVCISKSKALLLELMELR